MRRWWILSMILLMLPVSALADYEGTLNAISETAVTARYGGTVLRTEVLAGETVSEDAVLAVLDAETVYADRDGTVSRWFAEPGDEMQTAETQYGGALAVSPRNRFTIYCTAEKAKDTAENKYISAGETLYIKCTLTGKHRGVGIVTETDDMQYTVLCIGGGFSNGEAVYLYRDEDCSSAQKVGIGTVILTDADLYTGSGTLVGCYVAEGDSVERGQRLFSVASGSYNGDWNSGRITAPTAGILTELRVQPGDSVQAGETVAMLCRPEDLRVEFTIYEDELADVQEGDRMHLRWDAGSVQTGTVTFISRMADADGKYTVSVLPDQLPDAVYIGQQVTADLQ